LNKYNNSLLKSFTTNQNTKYDKNINCCELIEKVKDYISSSNWTDKDKYQGVEFLHKAASITTNRRIKE